MKIVKVYQCEFCGKFYKDVDFCIAHEKTCKKNSKALSCRECSNSYKEGVFTKCKKGYRISPQQFLKCKEKRFII